MFLCNANEGEGRGRWSAHACANSCCVSHFQHVHARASHASRGKTREVTALRDSLVTQYMHTSAHAYARGHVSLKRPAGAASLRSAGPGAPTSTFIVDYFRTGATINHILIATTACARTLGDRVWSRGELRRSDLLHASLDQVCFFQITEVLCLSTAQVA